MKLIACQWLAIIINWQSALEFQCWLHHQIHTEKGWLEHMIRSVILSRPPNLITCFIFTVFAKHQANVSKLKESSDLIHSIKVLCWTGGTSHATRSQMWPFLCMDRVRINLGGWCRRICFGQLFKSKTFVLASAKNTHFFANNWCLTLIFINPLTWSAKIKALDKLNRTINCLRAEVNDWNCGNGSSQNCIASKILWLCVCTRDLFCKSNFLTLLIVYKCFFCSQVRIQI